MFSLATVTTHPYPPTPSSDASLESPLAVGVEGMGRKRDGATALHPLAQQVRHTHIYACR